MAKTFWLTGLSGAGKSTLARELSELLAARRMVACMLDGDAVRGGLCSDLDYTPEGRSENIRRIAEVAKLANDSGVYAIVAAISPYRSDRERARLIMGKEAFIEIYISTSLATCAGRDRKGLYAKAKTGELRQFTGISAPYEVPLRPSLDICTDLRTIAECVSDLRTLVARAVDSASEPAREQALATADRSASCIH